MIMLDTCALLWRLFEPQRLSSHALKKMRASDTLAVSSVSFWEIGIKIRKKRLTLPLTLREMAAMLLKTRQVTILPVDLDIWLRALELKWEHKDPADRIIVSTAAKNGCPIATTDKRISRYYGKVIA